MPLVFGLVALLTVNVVVAVPERVAPRVVLVPSDRAPIPAAYQRFVTIPVFDANMFVGF